MPVIFGHVAIDEERIDGACNAYFRWKDLNTYISDNSHRGMNMPDAISEPMGCYALDLLWNRGTEAGDATNPRTMEKIEMKATSKFDGDLSSFGPRCRFDDLVFLRYNLYHDLLYVYDLHINSEDFGKYPVSRTQTVDDQKQQGKRPRLSLCEQFVEADALLPDCIFDIRRIKVYKPDTKKYQDIINEIR